MSDTPHDNIEPTFDKRYWLFWYISYAARGGMADFAGSFDTLQEAMKTVSSILEDGHVWDSVTREIVAQITEAELVRQDPNMPGSYNLPIWEVIDDA